MFQEDKVDYSLFILIFSGLFLLCFEVHLLDILLPVKRKFRDRRKAQMLIFLLSNNYLYPSPSLVTEAWYMLNVISVADNLSSYNYKQQAYISSIQLCQPVVENHLELWTVEPKITSQYKLTNSLLLFFPTSPQDSAYNLFLFYASSTHSTPQNLWKIQ